MKVPPELLKTLDGVPGFNRESFEAIHSSGNQITSIRINPFKSNAEELSHSMPIGSNVPWSQHGYYLKERPSFTFDPLFHAGCYYVQEASSMFLEQALKQACDLSSSLNVLDLCAAPGGKSTHILSLISPDSLLISNEIIRSRVNVLTDNLSRWGRSNVVVSCNDPRDFKKYPGHFDVLVIDAPCSGSGLIRRDPAAADEWSLQNVELCCQRQQRILADAMPCLKEEGILIYSTCSYSVKEDEDISKWLEHEFGMKEVQIDIDTKWNIVRSTKGLRFYPDKVQGEGFFLACFKKQTPSDNRPQNKNKKLTHLTANEKKVLEEWVHADQVFFKNGQTIHSIPSSVLSRVETLEELNIINTGTRVGELIRDKMVPDHMLALSTLNIVRSEPVELNYELAIRYLQRKELDLPGLTKGWRLVRYQGHNLGWINALGNRINNYYPKELRILKS